MIENNFHFCFGYLIYSRISVVKQRVTKIVIIYASPANCDSFLASYHNDCPCYGLRITLLSYYKVNFTENYDFF